VTKAAAINEFWNSFGLKAFEENTLLDVDENGQEIVLTASGARAEAGKTIAVDPDVIPLGSTVIINDQEYVAQDTGGAIQGNRIDIYCGSHEEALQLGVITAEVYMEG
jgi:3D (Asp-Asp-Asp) domain-containing protein